MISDRDLQRWDAFLAAEIIHLGAVHIAATGHPHRANPELVAFLKMNNGLFKEKVEMAIGQCAEGKRWPAWLTGDQIVNIHHRAELARVTLQAALTRQLPDLHKLRPPEAKDRQRFIRWLLIDLWNVGGVLYIDALTNEFLINPPNDAPC